jgi:predicted NUDIX family NTP pyrophosphohydrolase
MYRMRSNQLEVLLVHPGGPYAAGKDEDHWSIPKGEIKPGEGLLETARREFFEEVGIQAHGHFIALGTIRQKSGKLVHAWAFPGDMNLPREFHSNTFCIEWPPGSRVMREFPEIDRAQFFSLDHARRKLKAAQCAFLDRLQRHLQLPGSSAVGQVSLNPAPNDLGGAENESAPATPSAHSDRPAP